MKKIIFFMCLLLLPVIVLAKEYTVQDITVDFDESWMVFTRDNVVGHESLTNAGVDSEKVRQTMLENDTYIDSLIYLEDGYVVEGFVVIKEAQDNPANLHKYSESMIMKVGHKAYDSYDPSKLEIYEKNGYKFIVAEYNQNLGGTKYKLVDFYTVINGKGYTIKFQSTLDIASTNVGIKSIIDSVSFKIDPKFEKNPDNKLIVIGVVLMVVAAVGTTVSIIVNKNKGVNNNNQMIVINR